MHSVKVWDVFVRFTHWSVAAIVVMNYALTEEGSDIHQYLGYTAATLVGLRLIWGVIGSPYARFSSFFPTPERIKQHIRLMKTRQSGRELGHNPMGALMMFALWGCIIGLAATGYLMGTDAYWGSEALEALHEGLANGLIGLAVLHVAAVALMSLWGKTNLVRAMISGYKNVDEADKD